MRINHVKVAMVVGNTGWLPVIAWLKTDPDICVERGLCRYGAREKQEY